MATTQTFCSCGRYLDKNGQCFLHPPGEEDERARKFRVLRCPSGREICRFMHCTSEEGEVACPTCGEPMREAQWGTANSEADQVEDVRMTLNHRELINAWRRAAILGTIAAFTGWVLLLGEWLR